MRVLGVDVGGTFTDAVLIDGGDVRTAKVPTAASQEESVLAAVGAAGVAAGDGLDRFTHGTTAATNALLERRGARTAFLTTEGFEHLLHLRRQDRARLYRTCAAHPEPLVPIERCVGVRERMGPDGVVTPLDLDTVPSLADVEAIAVCLLHAYASAAHEQAVAERLRRRHPHAHVVASHEVAPEIREYERASTTAADAYLGPVLAGYLGRLRSACVAARLPEPLVMRSSGGVVTLAEAAAHPAWALLSGPAAGAVGAALVARSAGFADAIAFDMGGTSTDVCAVVGGEALREHERLVGGLPIRLPTLAIHTVGAGGGSIVWRDEGGALRVGPQSAGAHPGPACYGRGGDRATVTDANLLLGRLPAALPGGIALDADAAARALGDIDPAAVVAVVDAEMLRALRVVSVEQGLDPRDFALVAFGGAGPLHACALADELGMRTVLVPAAAGVLSALGLAACDERRDTVRGVVTALDEAGELPRSGEADLRYAGQSFELTVPLGPGLAERFHAAHEARYGYADRSLRIELVAVRTARVRRGPPVELRGPSLVARGPQLVELDGATCWVPAGWVGEANRSGTIRLERVP
jgi:N-methylhydantoinase A